MTVERFERLVLKLSNQMLVRHYLWLNYPYEPKIMQIEFSKPAQMDLHKELEKLGFVTGPSRCRYQITREEIPHANQS